MQRESRRRRQSRAAAFSQGLVPRRSPVPACPHCGYPIQGGYEYEYRSERQLFGLPLLHIISGSRIDPATGGLRVAKGIIAIGPMAVGGLALGGMSVGILSFGGVSLGLIALGGAALGLLLAVGGGAIGFVALGGGVIGYYALGGGGLASTSWEATHEPSKCSNSSGGSGISWAAGDSTAGRRAGTVRPSAGSSLTRLGATAAAGRAPSTILR